MSFDFESELLPERKKQLAKSLNMTPKELDSFLVDYLIRALIKIASGGCIIESDYNGNARIVNIQISDENVKIFRPLNTSFEVKDFLGYITDTNNKKYNRICKIEWHDWIEHGTYGLLFADNEKINFPDDKTEKFKKFFRRPYFLNPATYPTYEQFLALYTDNNGKLKDLAQDYQILFNEPLPNSPNNKFSNLNLQQITSS